MKRIALAFTIVASLMVVAPAPAEAHGVCAVTASRLGIVFTTTDRVVQMDAGVFCTDNHISTTIEVFLYRGNACVRNPSGCTIVYSDFEKCLDCDAVAIRRFFGGHCDNEERYRMRAFGFQRQDRHNIDDLWSNAIVCPDIVPG